MLGERSQEAGRRPALIVGLGSQRGPDLFDSGQPQLGKQQLDARGYRSGRPPSCGISRPHGAKLVVQMQRRQCDSDVGNGGEIGGKAAGEYVEDRAVCRRRALA